MAISKEAQQLAIWIYNNPGLGSKQLLMIERALMEKYNEAIEESLVAVHGSEPNETAILAAIKRLKVTPC